jgi:hypothetical protein
VPSYLTEQALKPLSAGAAMGVAISETFLGRMSGAEFRSFQERRPDRERWELVAGVPVMIIPPTIAHNRIASNLEHC